MPSSTTLVAVELAAIYALLVLMVAGRNPDQQSSRARRWLMMALLAALIGAVLNGLPNDAHADSRYERVFAGDLTQPALAIIATNLMLVLFGTQLLHYLQSRLATLWTLAGLGWWAAQAAASFAADSTTIGQAGWISAVYDPVELPNVLAFGGWLVIGVVLMLVALVAFYRARLPEIANQALFGAILVLLVVVGVALGASGESTLAEAGWVMQAFGLIGAVYSVMAYRVLDIRRTLRQAAATGIVTLITALVFFVALVAAQELNSDAESRYTILAGLALAASLVFTPLRMLIQAAGNRLFGGRIEGSSQLLRQFSEDITGVVELDALVNVTMRTLSQILRVRRGGMVLVVGESDDGLYLEPVANGLGEMPDFTGTLSYDSPIYAQFTGERAPLLQYDLDYGRAFAGALVEERRLFQTMRMSAYAPVVVQGQLVGILCSGAKMSDDPFTDYDLELLMTIANQAGVALRNARLVADLRRREAEQAELNKALSATKEQLEKLDDVKTDFITIASHELRTPLAQIRGYTDIMEAMNEEGLLDQDQIAGMTANLRKAADRLENLIGAMLDVSQLDVNAMDLRFSQVSVEHIMRTAIEPLTEAIKQRKLMLSARGMRDLPPIQADMQRLVQAFRNVVLNAIKFTPDGGRIDITGRLQDDEIIISIKDSGIGIAPENRDLIFEKFFRAHDPSLHSTGATKFMGAGPGLGLTIARGVVDAHGGRIWVESGGHDPEALPGSTFFIALPLNPPDEALRVDPFESTVSLSVKAFRDIVRATSGPPASRTTPRPPIGLRGDA